MHGTHPSTDSKCEHDAGKKVPHVVPWHSLAHAPGGDGTGGEGGSGGIGEGGSSAAASQQPEQSQPWWLSSPSHVYSRASYQSWHERVLHDRSEQLACG